MIGFLPEHNRHLASILESLKLLQTKDFKFNSMETRVLSDEIDQYSIFNKKLVEFHIKRFNLPKKFFCNHVFFKISRSF